MLEYLVSVNEVHEGGMRLMYQFDNGFGASLIKHKGSYGGEAGLWEIAIIDHEAELIYDTEITGIDGVKGWLTSEKAQYWLEQIKQLKEEKA